MLDKRKMKIADILQNVIIGLTVSFVALSLGAAFGILSGRGAFAGMMSAGIIAVITSFLGGTRVQCSGPTAPMSSICAVIVAYAYENKLPDNIQADHFVNVILILTGVILLIMGVLRLGKFICIVPNVVVSGFMNGIAALIWVDQAQVLLGLEGELHLNTIIVLVTLLIIYSQYSKIVPSTLIAIIVISAWTNFSKWSVEYMVIENTITHFNELAIMVGEQIPRVWSSTIILAALPFALQLALLCYLDTLLTSLVVDGISGESTQQNKELVAQGIANGVVSLFGGVPGAQATIRSVLMLKENATLRIAGISVGLFVLIELLAFQNLLQYIPSAVFIGILIKVGFDVFDFEPMKLYFNNSGMLAQKQADQKIRVTTLEMLLIGSTALITILIDLNIAVISMTILFHLLNKFIIQQQPLRDLKPEYDTTKTEDTMPD